MLRYGRDRETYNVGGEAELPNLSFIDTLCAAVDAALAVDPALKTRFPNAPAVRNTPTGTLKTIFTDRVGHDRRFAIDETKARAELGHAPARNFETDFAATLASYIANDPDRSPSLTTAIATGAETNYAARG